MSIWAIIENGYVVGVFDFEIDPEPSSYPPTWEFGALGENLEDVQVGWTATKINDLWQFNPQVQPPPTPEEIYQINFSEQWGRLTQAAIKIAPLVVEPDGVGDELNMWVDYYKELKLVDLTILNQPWPAYPIQGE